VKSLHILSEQELQIEDIKPRGVVAYKELIPQANDVSKIIELVFKVGEGVNNYRDVAGYFQFNERQSSHYREAAEALGLVSSANGTYRLTDVGKELVRLPAEQRNLFFAGLLADFNLDQRVHLNRNLRFRARERLLTEQGGLCWFRSAAQRWGIGYRCQQRLAGPLP
jgi:hypothetical protein